MTITCQDPNLPRTLYFSYRAIDINEVLLNASFSRNQELVVPQLITDGHGIFVEKTFSKKTQTQIWSYYKLHNTWKVLLGNSPNGIVIFVSSLLTGRVSHKEFTKCFGLLERLEPGYNIIAVRSFEIANIFPFGVTLNVPPFQGGRYGLNPEETDETVRIAAVRVHAERAICRINNHKILDGKFPFSLIPLMNQVFTSLQLFDQFFTTTCTSNRT